MGTGRLALHATEASVGIHPGHLVWAFPDQRLPWAFLLGGASRAEQAKLRIHEGLFQALALIQEPLLAL